MLRGICQAGRAVLRPHSTPCYTAAAAAALPHPTDEPLPTVALIGRPNVGKSTMFNRLVGRKVALVYDTPGSHVTRDYKEHDARLLDLRFRLVDTSGLEPFMSEESVQGRATAITAQLLRDAAAALLLVDARAGVTAADADVAAWLRRGGAASPGRVVVVAAKCDHYGDPRLLANVHEASALGLGEAVPYSAETQAGTVELYDALRPLVDTLHAERAESTADVAASEREAAAPNKRVRKRQSFAGWGGPQQGGSLQESEAAGASDDGGTAAAASCGKDGTAEATHAVPVRDDAPAEVAAPAPQGVLGRDAPIKLAIVGLPNAGKSTLLNTLLGRTRAITGPEPGLTRDAVTAEFEWEGSRFELVDTAGWMRRGTLDRFDDVGGRVAGLTVLQGRAKVNFAHAALLLVDAAAAAARVAAAARERPQVLSRRELDLAGSVLDEGRLLVIAANKLDALSQQERQGVVTALQEQINMSLASWQDCITVKPLTGATGRGAREILQHIVDTVPRWSTFVPPHRLNAWRYKMATALQGSGAGPLASLKYLKMVATSPPTFLAEWRPQAASKAYPLAVGRALRHAFGLEGVPVRVLPISKERRPDAVARPRSGGAGARRQSGSRRASGPAVRGKAAGRGADVKRKGATPAPARKRTLPPALAV